MLTRFNKKRVLVLIPLALLLLATPLLVFFYFTRSPNTSGITNPTTYASSKDESTTLVPQLAPKPTMALPKDVEKWSDRTTWNGSVPKAGSAVVIPKGKKVLLNVSPPALKSLTIEGTLLCDNRDLTLSANWIMVHGGKFQCGTEQSPFHNRLTVTLTGNNAAENIMGMGTKVLGVMQGGTLDLHGSPRISWTRLGATAYAGAAKITLEKPVDWLVGDRIVLASTDYNAKQSEEVTVTGVSGKNISISPALKYMHWGTTQTFAGQTIDERGEVGLLTRNIMVRGDESALTTGFGGHTMIMGNAIARLEGVEFYFMGQKARLGRYPVHWHLAGDGSRSYAKNNSIVHSFNRCLTIHGTNKLLVQSNVAFDTIGHCFFVEDAIETGNVLENNLGLGTHKPAQGQNLLKSDLSPATYWITNPNNIVRGNVAGGSEQNGFWYAFPQHPTGPSATTAVWPRYTPLGEFNNNVTHSNYRGIHVDDGMKPDGDTEATFYRPRSNPAVESAPVTAYFKNVVGYKNRDLAVWLRGSNEILTGAKLADNGGGAIFASNETFIQDSLIVGETANKGTPEPWEKKGVDGRALPQPWDEHMPIMGYSFYDGRVGAQRVTFVNFQSNSQRPASGLSYLRSNGFPLNVQNFAQSVRFINANQVYMETPHKDRDGDKAAVFLDMDGSVTGTAGRYVVVNNPFLLTGTCTFKKEWNTHICNERYVSLSVASDNGQVITPLTVNRQNGPSSTQVGVPNNPQHVSLSVLPGQSYTVKFPGAPTDKLRLRFDQVRQGDWVMVTVPYPNRPMQVYRDYNTYAQLKAAKSLAELNSSQGDKYFYDSATGMLHVKAMAQSGRDWTTVFADPK